MFVPFFSAQSDDKLKKLYRRKGGGGGKGGGSSGGHGDSGGGDDGGGSEGGEGSSGSSGSSSKGSSGSSSSKGDPVSVGGSTKTAVSYGPGGGKSVVIPAGQLFAGRTMGGGTRDQVYGNQEYGSGYPGVIGRGVNGRGFPFIFWPLAWGGAFGFGSANWQYLHTSEYGRPDNSSRPGGTMATAAFVSSSSNTTFRILADNITVSDLITSIQSNCSTDLSASSSSTPSSYADSLSSLPQPEQTIQYYRACSLALTLDGYNNTGALGPDGTPDTPLPTNIDTTLLNCLNQTIGAAVPLISDSTRLSIPTLNFVGFLWVLWCLSSVIL